MTKRKLIPVDKMVYVEGLKLQEPQWKVHVPNLLSEIQLLNPGTGTLRIPLMVFASLLEAVAKRASQLNDLELNRLMARLTLYSIADPEAPDYNPEKLRALLGDDDAL